MGICWLYFIVTQKKSFDQLKRALERALFFFVPAWYKVPRDRADLVDRKPEIGLRLPRSKMEYWSGGVMEKRNKNRGLQLKSRIICFTLLLGVTAFALAPSLRNNFTEWDDNTHLTGNLRIRELSPAAIFRIFSTHNYFSYDQPLVELTFALEYRFFRLNPRIYHLNNLLIHLLNCLLVFYLILSLGRQLPAAFIGALLFGIHPLQVESVAWIAERKNLLSSLFFLAAVISYLQYIEKNCERAYCLTIFFFVISVLAKPMALTLPPVLFLLDYFHRRRFRFRIVVEKIPFFLILALIVLIFNPGFGGDSPERIVKVLLDKPFAHILALTRQVAFHLIKLAFPFRLSAIYPQSIIRGDHVAPLIRVSPLWLITLTVLIIHSKKYTRTIIFASLFFLVMIAITFPVTLLYPWSAADRYTYLPAIGVYFLAAIAFWKLYRREGRCRTARKIILGLSLLIVVASFTALSRERTAAWENSQTLWSDAINKYPGIFLAHNNLGVTLSRQGKTEEAISHYYRALEIMPAYPDAHFNLGAALSEIGDWPGARDHYQQAILLNPGFAGAHLNLGKVFSEQGQQEEAAFHYREAIRIDPNLALAHYNLANTLHRQGDFQQAVFHYRRALELQPDYRQARHNLELTRKRLNNPGQDNRLDERSTGCPPPDE